MRKNWVGLIAILSACLIILSGGTALAGDYHTGTTLICSDCHIMHFSQTHGYQANGGGLTAPLGGAGPYTYLLRNDVNDLCLTCHDGQTFAPDVLEANSGSTVREAGALNRDGVAPYYTTTGHTLDSVSTAPGGTWAPDPVEGLTCVDCHHQHGRGSTAVPNSWRNLKSTPGGVSLDPPSYVIGTNDPTKDIFERTVASYDVADMDLNEPDQTKSAMGNWCGGCHASFHGAVGSANIGGVGSPPVEFERHPTAGVNIGATTGGHSSKAVFALAANSGTSVKVNWVKVMTATGIWKPNTVADVTDQTPTCVTCHKGHGNQNSFGLIYMDPKSGTLTEEGTPAGTYRNLCSQCHVQAL